MLYLRFFNTVLIPSNSPSDKVQVSVVRINRKNTSASQLEYLTNIFLHPSEVHGLVSVNTPLGNVVVLNPTAVERSLTLIPIPSGRYDQVDEDIKWYCTLERLSSVQPQQLEITTAVAGNTELLSDYEFTAKSNILDPNNESTLPSADLQRSSSNVQVVSMSFVLDAAQQKDKLVQSVYYNNDSRHTVTNLITTLVYLLHMLGNLSPLIDSSGPYFSNVLLFAVRKFQLDHNAALSNGNRDNEHGHTLPTSGHLTPATLRAMENLLRTQIENLERLGFDYKGKLVSTSEKEQAKLSKFIRHCQDSMAINVHMKGMLDSQTREEIDRLVADL